MNSGVQIARALSADEVKPGYWFRSPHMISTKGRCCLFLYSVSYSVIFWKLPHVIPRDLKLNWSKTGRIPHLPAR